MYLSSFENNDHNKKLSNNSFYTNNIDISLDIIKNVFINNTNIYFLDEIPQEYFLKKSKKIYYFKIVKNKKRGKRRLKSNSKLHDKNSQYNIICKIKVYFTKSLLEHANKLYNKNLEEDKINNKQYLLPINEKDKKININWFYRTAKEYLSSTISGKYNAHNKDYNKNQIDLIYTENENKDLIQFLEQNICTIYKEYISDEPSQIGIFKGLRTINDDLQYLKLKFNYDDDYIKEVKRISLNLEQIFQEKRNKNDKIK